MTLTKTRINNRGYGIYKWELITDKILTIDELLEAQEKEGYAYAGYSFHNPKKFQRNYKSGKTEFKYIWECYVSCD